MTTTEMMMAATDARFLDLFKTDWTVHEFGDYLLVSDTATRWWMRREDVPRFLAAWDDFTGDPVDRYTGACDAVRAMHDNEIPAEILAQAREELDCAACAWGF